MDNRKAYDQWSGDYDTMLNKTRDLEAIALRQTIAGIPMGRVLELGCGTGKNTEWLVTQAERLTGIDFSDAMLEKARSKITSDTVEWLGADIREEWPVPAQAFDLVTCSLVLEHIADIDFIFKEARRVLSPKGVFYIGELHPFKQYQGSRARFETETCTIELECFVHHVSDFFNSAIKHHFQCLRLEEWFDEASQIKPPRLISFLFQQDGWGHHQSKESAGSYY